ncbi:5-oxoprolinase subunit PxpA [Paraflavisolibacter sp. H34]|uniref:5-oxoprolinase subunit PxpA n=1 Tax=Huijunlia imazamoxiresistens TaxID=3127457 RepID=UPI00301A1D46
MLYCDLNCDLGEGAGNDAAIMPFLSSANIACGGHAGDADTMKRTVDLCLRYSVAIGAHPSYPDREQFGRVDLLGSSVKLEDLPGMIGEQVVALQQVCAAAGLRLHHVKPHGALYNRAAKDAAVSALICETIRAIDRRLILYGLSGSCMQAEAERLGLPFCSEVFADRTYADDGSLTPRTQPNALIEEGEESVRQVLQMVKEGAVRTTSGKVIPIAAGTICLHGDGRHAVAFARSIFEALKKEGISICSC